jgi:hypothetical protein
MAALSAVLLLLEGDSKRAFNSIFLGATLPPRNALATDSSGRYLDSIKESWERTVTARAGEASVVGRAAQFFVHFDPVRSGELFRRARKLDPEDPRWTEWLARLYQQEFQARRDESRPDWAAMALAEWENALSRCHNDWRRYGILCCAANCALEAHDPEKARSLAHTLLEGPFDSATREQARHCGHQFLGRVDLKKGDMEQAKSHLAASISPPPASAQLAIDGPRLELAKELLRHGETQTVLGYLKACAQLCAAHDARLVFMTVLGDRHRNFARWADQLERGDMPDFEGEI